MITEKRKVFLINFAYIAVLLLVSFAALQYVLPMLTPFAVAFVIAYLLKNPILFLQRVLHLPRKLSAILVVLLFYGAVGLILSLLGIKAFSELMTFVRSIPTIYNVHVLPLFLDILQNVEEIFLRMDASAVAAIDEAARQLFQSLEQLVSSLSIRAVGIASSVASALPSLFIQLVLLVISTFFIAIDYDRLTGFCLKQLNDGAKEVFLLIKSYVVGTLLVCLRSYLLIMSLTFVELSIGLTLIGIKHALLVAFIIALFDVLPVLGTGGIMIPWAILTVIRGDFPLALELLLIYVVITVIRNIIEPKIVGSQLGLHPVVTLSSMFVGAQLFGVFGLFGFPIALSLLRYLDQHGVIKLFK